MTAALLTGCILTCPKKQTTKPLDPHAFKSILDAREVDVAARNNHTKKGGSISFLVTWTIMIQSQGSIKLRDDETDIGTLDKIPEFRPPFEFVANDVLDESNPRDRVSDPGLTAKCDGGLLNAVTFFHMCCWYELLGPDICKHRTIYPAPPGCKQFREEAELNSNTCGSDLRTWMVSKLKYCTEAEASPTKAVHTTIKASMGKVEPSLRTSAGLGPRTYQYRSGEKASWHDYYKVILPGSNVKDARPVRLKREGE